MTCYKMFMPERLARWRDAALQSRLAAGRHTGRRGVWDARHDLARVRVPGARRVAPRASANISRPGPHATLTKPRYSARNLTQTHCNTVYPEYSPDKTLN